MTYALPVAPQLTTVKFPSNVARLAVFSLMMAAFSSTWSGFHLAFIQVGDVFLVLTLSALTMMVLFADMRVRVPKWVWIPPIALLLCITAHTLLPISGAYLMTRYEQAVIKPGNIVKAAFWTFALLGVPLAVIGCTKLEPRVPRWIMASFLAGASMCSLVALTDFAGVTHIAQSLGYESISGREPGLTVHPNALAFVCAIAAPFAVYFMTNGRWKWVSTVALVLLLGGVLVSGSRGAQVIFPLAVVASVMFTQRRRQILGWLAGTSVVAAAAGYVYLSTFASGTLDELFRFGGAGASSDSDSLRIVLANQAITDFEHFPLFGLGIKHIVEAHNIFLQVVSAGGLVLITAMLAYWFSMLRACWQLRSHGETLGPFLLVSIIVWLLLGVIENQLTDRMLYYSVGAVAALAAKIVESGRTDSGR